MWHRCTKVWIPFQSSVGCCWGWMSALALIRSPHSQLFLSMVALFSSIITFKSGEAFGCGKGLFVFYSIQLGGVNWFCRMVFFDHSMHFLEFMELSRILKYFLFGATEKIDYQRQYIFGSKFILCKEDENSFWIYSCRTIWNI